jgi:hypothetical protein
MREDARKVWHSTRHPTDKIEWNRVCMIKFHGKIKEMKNETLKSYLCGLSAKYKSIIRYGKSQDT